MSLSVIIVAVVPMSNWYTGTHQLVPSRIGLVVMVRNEAHILPRLLSSLDDSIEKVFICDTGSTDETVRVAREWSTKVHVHHLSTFVNFEHSRNECRQRINATGLDWIMLMDADFTVDQFAPTQRPLYDVNTIQIHSSVGPHNSLPMLIRAELYVKECRYRLWTHEFLHCPQNATRGFYNGFIYRDHSDGTSRGNKTTRDVRLLEQWIEERGEAEADVLPRALYYLARAYEDSNDTRALAMYERHNQVQDMTNYQFYAHYRMAHIEMQKNPANATQIEQRLWDAFGTYDGLFRREPIYYLAKLHRHQGNYHKCILYGLAGMSLPEVNHQRVPLFLEPLIYNWVLEEELAFCLYKTQHYAHALERFQRIRRDYAHTMDHSSLQRLDEEIKACKEGGQF
jgi:glycosyltransferase involved in cell wall biosynthesis